MGLNIFSITFQIFEELEKKGIKYCIYNGYEKLPYKVESDLDIAIEKRAFKFLDDIILKISEANNAILLHKIWHDVSKIAYIITPPSLIEPDRLQLDFFFEFSARDFTKRNNLKRYFLMKEEKLLENRQKKDYFYIPSAEKEFLMKLLRRILKNDFSNEKFSKIRNLFLENEGKSTALLKEYFPENYKKIVLAIKTGNLLWFKENIQLLKRELKKFKSSYLSPYRIYLSFKRTFYRIKFPVGMTVAFLGPDGSGKSTIAREIMRVLSKSFHGEKLFYWRPGLLKQPGVALGLREEIKMGTNPYPHGHKPEHPLKSLLRFIYYLIDFTLGYWIKVWPLKVKKHLCVFDRYYYDVLVDSFRYNFSLPKWLLKVPLPIIPKPDLVIILDVLPEKLFLRKQELPEKELNRQRKEFNDLINQLKNIYIIENNSILNDVIIRISKMILKKKSEKTIKAIRGMRQ